MTWLKHTYIPLGNYMIHPAIAWGALYWVGLSRWRPLKIKRWRIELWLHPLTFMAEVYGRGPKHLRGLTLTQLRWKIREGLDLIQQVRKSASPKRYRQP